MDDRRSIVRFTEKGDSMCEDAAFILLKIVEGLQHGDNAMNDPYKLCDKLKKLFRFI